MEDFAFTPTVKIFFDSSGFRSDEKHAIARAAKQQRLDFVGDFVGSSYLVFLALAACALHLGCALGWALALFERNFCFPFFKKIHQYSGSTNRGNHFHLRGTRKGARLYCFSS